MSDDGDGSTFFEFLAALLVFDWLRRPKGVSNYVGAYNEAMDYAAESSAVPCRDCDDTVWRKSVGGWVHTSTGEALRQSPPTEGGFDAPHVAKPWPMLRAGEIDPVYLDEGDDADVLTAGDAARPRRPR